MNFLRRLLGGKAGRIIVTDRANPGTSAQPETDANSYFQLGVAKGFQRDFEGCIKDLTRAIELEPHFAVAYFNRGSAKQAKGDFDGAIADHTKAIELKPGFPLAFFNRGEAKYSKGDFDGAIADHTKAIELQQDIDNAYCKRGNAKQVNGDLDGAITDYTEAIKLRPDDVSAYHNRGKAKQTKGDLDGAIADYTEAIKLRPDDVSTYHDRGKAKQAKGDLDGAISDQTKANQFKAGSYLGKPLHKESSVLQAVIDKDPTLALDRLHEGASPNEKGQYGNVALHYAAAYGYLDVIEAILRAGGAVDTKNGAGQTPLVYSMMEGQPAAARFLWKHQSFKFSESGREKHIKELCSIGVDWTFLPSEASSGYFQKGSHIGHNFHPRARQIGEELHKIGGIEAMRDAHASITEILGAKAASNLSSIWNHVGDWLD
jgi:tetratricopeptide (TPR) repeat protein